MLVNTTTIDRINKVKAGIEELMPDFIENCVKHNDFIYEEHFLTSISILIDHNLWYVSDVLDLYNWMGVSLDSLNANYKIINTSNWVPFKEFIALYKERREAQDIVNKLVKDLEDIERQDRIDDLELIEQGFRYV